MRNLIWTVGLWLLGIAQAQAMALNAPETLSYDVYWGLIHVGEAKLTYLPDADGGYTLRAEVKDDSALIDLHDTWESRGRHLSGRAFVPQIYSVKQAENDYRSDKTMTFDPRGEVVYVNHIDPSDKADALKAGIGRDALATVYDWRLGGPANVARAASVPVVNIKRLVTLQRKAAKRVTLKIGNRSYATWRVDMSTVKDNGKAGKETWTVYVTDDAAMVPVQIVAGTKFGTFRASLKN